jgi:hypothetical protein
MDTWSRVEIGAPTISSEERLVSKDKELGYIWFGTKPQTSFSEIFATTKIRRCGDIQIYWVGMALREQKILCWSWPAGRGFVPARREPVARKEGAADQFRWHAFAAC